MVAKKRMLSKSQVNLYLQCPLKWKFQYIDDRKSPPSYPMLRGNKLHSEVETFYKHINLIKAENALIPFIAPKRDMKNIQNFVNFEKERIKSCTKDGKFALRYFKPVFQELKVTDTELAMRGFIDAVYINPKDDKLIVVDWKSGKYRPENLDDYRFELAFYKVLLERSKKVDVEVGYWGIYFLDADKLFFEPVDQKYVDKMHATVEKARKGMEQEEHKPKINMFCNWCEFKDECTR